MTSQADHARCYTEHAAAGTQARTAVDALAFEPLQPQEYAQTLREVGRCLGASLLVRLKTHTVGDLCIVCTAEDADYLARGLIETLEKTAWADHVRLWCMWNVRRKVGAFSIAPVVQQYSEAFDSMDPIVVVVKSIISGGCVVKTNLTRLLTSDPQRRQQPESVFIIAPVMLRGAEDELKKEFPADIACRFEYLTCVIDSEKRGDNVFPGIGGSVYERLGFAGEAEKNQYYPSILQERKRRFDHVM